MKKLLKARWMTSLIFLILLFAITGIAAPEFLTYDNIITCFNTATMYTLLAVGIAFVIMTGEIDVSIGAVAGCRRRGFRFHPPGRQSWCGNR